MTDHDSRLDKLERIKDLLKYDVATSAMSATAFRKILQQIVAIVDEDESPKQECLCPLYGDGASNSYAVNPDCPRHGKPVDERPDRYKERFVDDTKPASKTSWVDGPKCKNCNYLAYYHNRDGTYAGVSPCGNFQPANGYFRPIPEINFEIQDKDKYSRAEITEACYQILKHKPAEKEQPTTQGKPKLKPSERVRQIAIKQARGFFPSDFEKSLLDFLDEQET